MWIELTDGDTTELYNRDIMDEPVSFSDSGTAQVSKDVGKALIDKYDNIERKSETTGNGDDEEEVEGDK